MDGQWLLLLSVIATSIHLSSGRFDATSVSAFSSSVVTQPHMPTTTHMLIDPSRLCRKGRNKNLRDSMNFIHGKTQIAVATGGRRHRRKVRSFCNKEPEMIREAKRGSQIATTECQYQFKNRHWNCSALPRSIRRVLSRDTRETAYVHAITAAGVTFSVTQACSSGQVQDCPCDRTLSGKSTDGSWEWGGCGDNVFIGYERSKDILDIKIRRRSDIRSLMLLHNNEAGRLAVKNNMRLVCKCHGLSGSCTLKTCWQKVPSFREIGEMLKLKFDGAVQVIPGNDGKSLVPSKASIKPPEKDDLIYFDESLDFCQYSNKTGSLGTQGRECNATSYGVDGCELLCCGRGYRRRRVTERKNCRCKFHWCCEVTCDTCIVTKEIYTCR
ncbi:protein Wnt-1 [Folsomia candida]|uniref:protein Wnt-1 n=1 Tax=Folsomia candida TaxID=158441 RepID=UPI000B8F54B0|nr:protein Wnt-1 [Folsomia candida]